MSAEDIIKGQEAFDLKMRKAKAWDELDESLRNYEATETVNPREIRKEMSELMKEKP